MAVVLQAGTIGGTLLNVDSGGLLIDGPVTLDASSVLNVSAGSAGIAYSAPTSSLTLGGLSFLAAESGRLDIALPIHNAGTLVVDNAQEVSVGTIDGSGTVELGVGTLDVSGGIAASQSIRFISNSATLGVARTYYGPPPAADIAAPISGFGPGDFIDLGNLKPDGLAFSAGTLTVSKGGTTLATLTFAGAYAATDFHLATDAAFHAAVTTTAAAAVPSPATLPVISGTAAVVAQQAAPFAGLTIADSGIDSLAVSVVGNTGSLSSASPGGATGNTGNFGAVGSAASLTALLQSVVETPAATAPPVDALVARIAATNANGTAFDDATAFVLRQYGAAATAPPSLITVSFVPDGTSPPAPIAGQLNEAFVATPPSGGSSFLPSGFAAIYLGYTGDGTLVDPGFGNAVLAGNSGNDVIYALGTSDILVAGSGSDTMVATGASTMLAGAATGNAVVFGGSGATSIDGPSGSGARATIVAGSGATTITTAGGPPVHDLVALGAGSDVLNAAGADTIFAGTGASTITVTSFSPDLIALGSGPSVVREMGMPAGTILGGSGTAVVSIQGYAPVLAGSVANPATAVPYWPDLRFIGGSGSATVVGGGTLLGGTDGNNAITLDGYDPESTAFGAGSGDVLTSFANGTLAPVGKPALVAGVGNETLIAAPGSNANEMVAGPGADAIMALGAQQTVFGGTGAAAITEGSGNTVLLLSSVRPGGADSITGFDPSLDTINLGGYAPGTGAAALASATAFNGSETLTLGDGTRVTLLGFTGLGPAHLIG